MQIFKNKKALIHCISILKEENKQIGFVPTMGALHQGHLSLVAAAKKNNDISLATIFVNPTQFNKSEDLEKYPKTIENDLNLLRSIDCDIVFIPSVDEIYSNTISSKRYSFGGIENQMEGKFRAGHFDGVATIIQLFFEIIQPNRAYFGEKDYQQLQVVKKLAEQENSNVEVIGCPIFREEDGLAMSSRNMRLSELQRNASPLIYKTLNKVYNLINTKDIKEIYTYVQEQFDKNSFLELEYFTIANQDTLQEVTSIKKGKNHRAFIAVNAGTIRLIDNLLLPANS